MKKIITLFVLLCSITTAFAQRTKVEVIYDYLYVFPSEIGVFDSKPSRVIEQLNSNSQYGYNSWRLPDEEELALLKANGYAKADGTYMTANRSNSRGAVLLVTTKQDIEKARKKKADQEFMASVSRIKTQTGYIDLGLPSGTKWAAQNYGGSQKYYTHSQVANLPSQTQWQELRRECTWTWIDSESGFIIKGQNGNAIFLNATYGFITWDGTPQFDRRGVGVYWSSSWLENRKDKEVYWSFDFEDGKIFEGEYLRNKLFEDYRACVRCVMR